MTIRFIIPGNVQDEDGELEPYKKDWQAYIRDCFYKQFKMEDTSVVVDDALADAVINDKGYPIRPVQGMPAPIDITRFSVSMYVDMYWATAQGNSHAVFSALYAALFPPKTTLRYAEFQSQMSDDRRGKVHVTIRIQNNV